MADARALAKQEEWELEAPHLLVLWRSAECGTRLL